MGRLRSHTLNSVTDTRQSEFGRTLTELSLNESKITMSIELEDSPLGGMKVVSDALELLAQARPVHKSCLAGSGLLAQRQLISPQKVYHLPLDMLAESNRLDKMADWNPLQSAKAIAWQYLIVEGDRPIEIAETTLGDSSPISFSRVNRGPQVEGFVEAVRTAENIAEEKPTRNWQLRYLRISALYIEALWLHDLQQNWKSDLLIPVQPAFPPLKANRAYSTLDFFRHIRKRAERRFQSSDATNG